MEAICRLTDSQLTNASLLVDDMRAAASFARALAPSTSARARDRSQTVSRAGSDASSSSSSSSSSSNDVRLRLDPEPDSALGAHGLGTHKIHRGRRILAFEPARKFVWFLALRDEDEWRDWCANSRRGAVFVPRDPAAAYADDGWCGWDDWLGLTVDFETARAWAREQGFKSQQDWWSKTAALPHRIPERPGQFYRNKGWSGYTDFLGLVDASEDAEDEDNDGQNASVDER